MAVRKNIRVYDLARELKQDTKRILEDLRREGADVSVPSNSVPKELADKIRTKYFPKVDKAPKRTIKVIKKKKVAKPEPAEEVAVEEAATEAAEAEPVEEVKAEEAPKKAAAKKVVKLKKQEPAKAEEKPEPEEAESAEPAEAKEEEKKPASKRVLKVSRKEVLEKEAEEEDAPEIEADAAEAIEQEEAEPVEAKDEDKEEEKKGRSVTRLKLTKKALEAGVKPGERITTPKPSAEELQTERTKGRKRKLRGTPGETATPKTVYTPPPSHNRRPGRGGRKGRRFADRTRQQENDFEAPRKRSIEERISDQIGKTEAETSKTVRLTEGATIREFAEGLGVTPRDIVQLLVKKGIFATLNQPINEETAFELAENFGVEVSFVPFEEMVIEQEFEELIAADSDDVEIPRAPVVTVMGHVDHGKTSLLDAIRSDNIAEGEAGGITQHIGAYSVLVPSPDEPDEQRRLVFLDTPGHEAFTMMRARGAKATDIVILVVAADDGVMPQTIEAIEHSKAAGVPIIVAINKIDRPEANADKVKTELSQQGLNPVDWGGDIEMVPVSAKNHDNLDTLLETVLLQAEIMDLKASPTRRASGVVLEAELDKGRGSVGTILVQQGTLKIGDPFIVGQFYGKVRAMFSDRGERVEEVEPSTPVEVLGLQGVPQAGDVFQAVSDIDKAQTIANQRQQQARQIAMMKTTKRGIESLGQANVKELLVVVKADVQGSVEVLKSTLEKLSTEKVKVRVIRSGVGAITESDVLLASATQAEADASAVVIIGFNVRPGVRAVETAKQDEVDIRLHSIIYKVEEEIKAAMIGMLDAIEKEVILGKAQVLETYKVSRIGTIAGCRVTDGLIRRQAKARLIRDGVVIWSGDIASLKRFKDDANEVKQGYECGMSLVNFNDIKVDDEIEAFVIEEIAPTELE
ncbi:MAG: translation initiation factor IF-2 [Acidobacteria bacterium]|nr:MAG: translation initiation factor IF-2 [Acidobacteriota bacterium]REK01855.1 MAG: translation initiation factor IF-2 [Acidobacteriota bacterium]REK14811.1 MAG: translation initiation factor IF-2 [Acidobacteriota bacterium]REK45526.1 MAG: translation initiation factor IF-2 [Acidobacteriota bacterium]